jgi:hypothetical protein
MFCYAQNLNFISYFLEKLIDVSTEDHFPQTDIPSYKNYRDNICGVATNPLSLRFVNAQYGHKLRAWYMQKNTVL